MTIAAIRFAWFEAVNAGEPGPSMNWADWVGVVGSVASIIGLIVVGIAIVAVFRETKSLRSAISASTPAAPTRIDHARQAILGNKLDTRVISCIQIRRDLLLDNIASSSSLLDPYSWEDTGNVFFDITGFLAKAGDDLIHEIARAIDTQFSTVEYVYVLPLISARKKEASQYVRIQRAMTRLRQNRKGPKVTFGFLPTAALSLTGPLQKSRKRPTIILEYIGGADLMPADRYVPQAQAHLRDKVGADLLGVAILVGPGTAPQGVEGRCETFVTVDRVLPLRD